MSGAARPKTLYEKLEALPEELIAEIIDGQLHTQPRPAPRHAVAASNLGAELIAPYSRAKGGPGGWSSTNPSCISYAIQRCCAELMRTGAFGAETSPAAAPFEAAVFRVGDLWT